jgi:hypothetical protein
LDLIRVFIDPPNGIPCGPQSQFMKFNNERNTKRLKTNFDSTIKTFYSKLKSFNRQEWALTLNITYNELFRFWVNISLNFSKTKIST